MSAFFNAYIFHWAQSKAIMKIVFLVAMIFIVSGCAASIRSINSSTCANDSFVPQNVPNDCKKEVCVDGKIVSIEELTETAPVYGWAEEKFCLFHPIDCLRAYRFKKSSQWDQDMTKEYWSRKSLHNGLGDAARHAYLMCTFTEQFGVDFARGLAVAHEEDSGYLIFSHKGGTGNPCCEKVLDLYNNEIGIMLAGKPGTCEDKVLNSLHLLRYSLCEEEKKESPGSSNSE